MVFVVDGTTEEDMDGNVTTAGEEDDVAAVVAVTAVVAVWVATVPMMAETVFSVVVVETENGVTAA